MTNDKLNKNFEYVKKNFDTLLNIYRNKHILVYEQKVVGSFDTYEAAAKAGINTYGLDGSFLVYFITETAPINFLTLANL